MKKLILTALAAATAMAGLAAAPAQAAQGCGPGWHRGYYGECRPNGPRFYERGPIIVERYHPHRGWWDGHRYWENREHWHGGWRYW